jgi:hypothetical protein
VCIRPRTVAGEGKERKGDDVMIFIGMLPLLDWDWERAARFSFSP